MCNRVTQSQEDFDKWVADDSADPILIVRAEAVTEKLQVACVGFCVCYVSCAEHLCVPLPDDE